MEDIAAQQMRERIYSLAGGLLAACDIPVSQVLELALGMVERMCSKPELISVLPREIE